ncbi:MAG: pyruvate, phosphate dikinase [Candidatus Altiarchaeota archaeon]
MKKKYVYLFEESRATEESLFVLGNKGAQLAEMTAIGLPVPPGFTISTAACLEYLAKGGKLPEGLMNKVKEKLALVEKKLGKKFGDNANPLLFSVRSGSYVSMPGMMDTVLNLGLNDASVEGFAKKTGSERGAWDSYRRLVNMFGDVVMGVAHEKFEEQLDEVKKKRGVKLDTELSVEDLKDVVARYKKVVKDNTGEEFPQDPWMQLEKGVEAVFRSWNVKRAVDYRRINKLRDDAGTAVNCQAMVFGNMGDDCGTGVGFTRNPATGDKEHYGEWLINAQGEDVVAGIRTPKPIDEMKKVLPEAYDELIKIYELLEKHYKDMQDFEFTVEKKKLYLLQTRTGKRTAQAAVKIAADMHSEGLITKDEAVMRVKPEQLDQLLHKQINVEARLEVIAKGLPASPGAAVGKVVFTADEAERLAEEGEKVILVRNETSPEDIHGMAVAQGILTARGGMTSHAAVVARGMGKCCVAGCEILSVSEKERKFTAGDHVIKEGEVIALNGNTGEVILGEVELIEPKMAGEFATLMAWADAVRTLGVRTNADTPHDSKVARDFGAEGIGLCRTEHMFFEGDRIKAVREMILGKDEKARRKALDKLLPMQKGDFKGIFEVMDGLPVTIRLLDPPLHEFLPHEEKDIQELADELNVPFNELKNKVQSLHELNPMLGHRGCRLAVTYPEIAEMQARAIIEAACEVKEAGKDVKPEIMIPLVGHVNELKVCKERVVAVAEEVLKASGTKVSYKVGTMIEIPRACLTADEIAKDAEFFSFGTNDLTQMTFGFSRDDAGKFLPEYVSKKILPEDPFQSIDQDGVGKLVEMAVNLGRKSRKDLKIGICGEHGGEPKSVAFCHKTGLNYVSCSPYRVPIARLAAAQAKLKEKKGKK